MLPSTGRSSDVIATMTPSGVEHFTVSVTVPTAQRRCAIATMTPSGVEHTIGESSAGSRISPVIATMTPSGVEQRPSAPLSWDWATGRCDRDDDAFGR